MFKRIRYKGLCNRTRRFGLLESLEIRALMTADALPVFETDDGASGFSVNFDALTIDTTLVSESVDINSLVQHILREAYLQGHGDLHMHAAKVGFFSSIKEAVRDELQQRRVYRHDHNADVDRLHQESEGVEIELQVVGELEQEDPA